MQVTAQTAPSSRPTVLRARGPFSLPACLRWLSCFPANDDPLAMGSAYRRAHSLRGRVLLLDLRSGGSSETLHLRVIGVATPEDRQACVRLVRRQFSLDLDGDHFYRVLGASDPALRAVQERYPGLRPVLFGSPFEALCWAIIGQRIRMSQAARLKARLREAFGPSVSWRGSDYQAFPAPADLGSLEPAADARRLGISETKLQRLVSLAERGQRGELDAELLAGMPIEEAKAHLMKSPGVGPWGAEFTLIRAVGRSNMLPKQEARLYRAIEHAYGLNLTEQPRELERLSQRWGECRSWVAFLFRVAAHDDGVC